MIMLYVVVAMAVIVVVFCGLVQIMAGGYLRAVVESCGLLDDTLRVTAGTRLS